MTSAANTAYPLRVDDFLVRIAADHPLGAGDEAAVRAHLAQMLGIRSPSRLGRLDVVPRTPLGKFMTATCEV